MQPNMTVIWRCLLQKGQVCRMSRWRRLERGGGGGLRDGDQSLSANLDPGSIWLSLSLVEMCTSGVESQESSLLGGAVESKPIQPWISRGSVYGKDDGVGLQHGNQ